MGSIVNKTVVAAVVAGVTVLGVLAAVTLLAWHGTIPGSDAVKIFLLVLAGGGVGTAVHTGVTAGAKAANSSSQ
jgi:hypothetical protein